MFTGIVEEKGKVRYIQLTGESGILAVKARKVLEGTRIGDSIAVNGVCLTVTSIQPDGFTADVMAETIRRSSLGSCKAGSQVNLERAMAADGRFGGHIVSGHIDGTGVIRSMLQEENAIWVSIETSPQILHLFQKSGFFSCMWNDRHLKTSFINPFNCQADPINTDGSIFHDQMQNQWRCLN